VKPGGLGEFEFVAAGYEIRENDTFLVAGHQDNIASFGTLAEESRKGANRAIRRLFGRQQKEGKDTRKEPEKERSRPDNRSETSKKGGQK
jgi:hypothetical protein